MRVRPLLMVGMLFSIPVANMKAVYIARFRLGPFPADQSGRVRTPPPRDNAGKSGPVAEGPYRLPDGVPARPQQSPCPPGQPPADRGAWPRHSARRAAPG